MTLPILAHVSPICAAKCGDAYRISPGRLGNIAVAEAQKSFEYAPHRNKFQPTSDSRAPRRPPLEVEFVSAVNISSPSVRFAK